MAKKAAKAGQKVKPAKVSRYDVKKVASAARLSLSEKELGKFANELERILDAFKELEGIDTANVKPSFQPVGMENRLRKDEARPSLPQEKALKNAKNRENGFVRGPRV